MNLFEKISLGVQVLTLVAASYIGVVQNQINTRQAALQDYVAVSAMFNANAGQISLLNTGRMNLYIERIEANGEVTKYDRPRLLSTGTLDSSYYWIAPPATLEVGKNFPLSIYLVDEYGKHWVSEHEGHVYEQDVKTQDGKTAKVRLISLWSYQTKEVK